MSVTLFSQLMSEQGYVQLFSRALDQPIVIARDPDVAVPPGLPVYTLAECDRLLSGQIDASGLRDLHAIKTRFSGVLDAITFDHPIELSGPSLVDLFPAPRPALPSDAFSACFSGLSEPAPVAVRTEPLPPPSGPVPCPACGFVATNAGVCAWCGERPATPPPQRSDDSQRSLFADDLV